MQPSRTEEPAATILMVEDEADLAWVVRFNLELEGHETFVASDGQGALELLEEITPDLILLDLMMPVMDGWAVLHEVRRRGLRSRVIVVSARASQPDRRRAEDYAVDAFVAKPFEMDELLATIRSLLPPPRRQE
jgi:two-component system response regulator VicR